MDNVRIYHRLYNSKFAYKVCNTKMSFRLHHLKYIFKWCEIYF